MSEAELKESIQHIDSLSALALECLTEREKAMGTIPSGIFSYYSSRIKSGKLFLRQELAVVRWVVENLKDTDVILDIGCGVGQDTFLLAANGFRCIAVEGDGRRYGALVALKEAVDGWNPAIGARVTTRKLWFPTDFDGLTGLKSVAFFAGFVGEAKDEAALIRSLRQFSHVIIDLVRFGSEKRDATWKQLELLNFLAAEGLVSVAHIFAWENGNFQLFERR